MDDLHSAQYLIALENPEPSNYTRIPNILKHLTYDDLDPKTGEISVKRLSVYACHLYSVLKDFAGNENDCWRNTEHIAEMANMSMGMVSKCKKELQQKFHELDGNSLIVVTEHAKPKDKNNPKAGGTVYHKTLIKNIWGYNRAFFLQKKIEKKMKSLSSSPSPHENEDGSHSCHENESRSSPSPHETNKTLCSKPPLFVKQHSTAEAVSVCSSSNDGGVLAADSTNRVFNWLTKQGCPIPRAVELSLKYSLEELNKAIEYAREMSIKKQRKNEKLENPLAYILNALKNRYWIESAT